MKEFSFRVLIKYAFRRNVKLNILIVEAKHKLRLKNKETIRLYRLCQKDVENEVFKGFE